MLDEFVADLRNGHNVIATVYAECGVMYRETGPEAFRSVGEAEFAAVMARLSDTGHFGPTRICAGFVGNVDLALGAAVDEVIEAMLVANHRLRGIRARLIWDADPEVSPSVKEFAPRGLMADARFREGVARLGKYGLNFEAWLFYPQLPELVDLSEAFTETTFVANHCGGLVGRGPYASSENFDNWKACVIELAKRPNVVMKLGSLAIERTGFGYETRTTRPTEDELVRDWRPYVETCIEAFGAHRCLFESNYPVDAVAGDYRTLWNVYKRIAAGCSRDEKTALFSGTARHVYRLDAIPVVEPQDANTH
jgi:predicted TIM-barrel fold metal-dependent hydrolase